MAGPLVGGPTWRQTALINDLLEAVESDPSSIDARKLLAEQYQTLGWDDAAADVAEAILQLDSRDHGAVAILVSNGRKHASVGLPSPAHQLRQASTAASMSIEQLRDGYQSLREEATILLREMLVFQEMAPGTDCSQQIADLRAMTEGKVPNTSTTKTKPARSARALAAKMKVDWSSATETAIADFENIIRSTCDGKVQGLSKEDADVLRETLRKRVDAVKSALPIDKAYYVGDAFMHIEHEILQRVYTNPETMLGDPISEIPRAAFWSSEDGYAWDLSELVQAIKANKGAMRNPLSRDHFTAADVEAVIRHPIGAELAAMQVEQSMLFQGVRQDTVVKLQSMAKTLLEDDTEDSRPSHTSMDDFLAYVATLPSEERKAIDKLRVPAVDTHTGQKFDDTIGDAVRDAKGNRVCLHKAGDLLRQAAEYLSGGNRVAIVDTDDC